MIDTVALRNALRVILVGVSGLPVARSWENRQFTPPDPPADWVRETLMPAIERQASDGNVEAIGVVQYDLFTPAGKGTEAIEALADTIKTVFKPRTVPAPNIIIDRSERGTAQQEPLWYQIPVRITYRAFAAL